MKIVVILGRVLDPSGIVVKGRLGRIFVNREEYVLHPADRCALEAALCVKDTVGADVMALPRGPLPDDDVLRQALATGADRAVYLTGDELKDADDAVMARVLAAAVERLNETGAPTVLVLIGATTLDTGQGQLGPRLAEALGWSHISGAWRVEVADGQVRAVRQEATGYVTVEAGLPAVVMVPPGTHKLRYPDGVRLVNVYREKDAVERWNANDLVDGGTLLSRPPDGEGGARSALQPLLEKRGRDFPPERARGERVMGTAEDMAQAVADALEQRVRR